MTTEESTVESLYGQPQLEISERLRVVLPPLSEDELKQLEENILRDGMVSDPILYWEHEGHCWIVDGMNRWGVIQKHGLKNYLTTCLEFANWDDVEIWMIQRQLGKRNLLDKHDLRLLIGGYYEKMKRKDLGHGDQKTGSEGGNCPPIPAAVKVAEETGKSERSVKEAAEYTRAFSKLCNSLQTAVNNKVITLTLDEALSMAQLSIADQAAIYKEARQGNRPLKEVLLAKGKFQQKRPKEKKPDRKVKPSKKQKEKPVEKIEESIVVPVEDLDSLDRRDVYLMLDECLRAFLENSPSKAGTEAKFCEYVLSWTSLGGRRIQNV